jgi:ribosomal protein L7/L12
MKLSKEQKRELERLIASGDKLEAIKQFRNMADVGLAEAKAFIENLESGGHRSTAHEEAPRNVRQAEQAALAAIKQGNLVEAIKRYHQHSKVGLKEAKDAVDALSIMHRTDGRVNPKLARTLLDMVKAGQKEDAITQLMSQTGFDDAEARAFLKTLGGITPGGGACGAGCLKMLLGLLVLGGLAWVLLSQLASQ